MQNHPLPTIRLNKPFAWLGILVAIGLLSGCGVSRGMHKSDDYIVYKLQKTTTAEALAERFLKNPRRAWVIEEANLGTTYEKGKTVIIPLKDDNRAGLFREGYQVVPILCYHRFGKTCRSALCVSETSFRAQLEYLRDNDYHTISLAELYAFLTYQKAIPLRSVVITIDDGYRSIYDIAYPLLKEFGFTATFFVYTDFIGATKLSLTWDQLREMKAAGFEVESHSVTHSDLSLKQKGESEDAYRQRITSELTRSKAIIDRELDQNTRFLAYPYSKYNRWILSQTAAAGYLLGLTVERGANPFFMDHLVLKRNQILKEDLDYFSSRIPTLNPVKLD
ncbi:MAG: polysaccharide deacetylase family protein [Desulfobacterales bacterium]|jgi:peptidoglycan/xylan/chitin deacetylase (PgdA/CDA1 family)